MNERIIIDPKICHGKPIIRGTRVPVARVVGYLAGGMSFKDTEKDFNLTQEDIRAVLCYAAEIIANNEDTAVFQQSSWEYEFPPFSKWTLWKERCKIPDVSNSYGVYLFAKFSSEPPNIVTLLDNCIVYIGEAKNTFGQRWSKGKSWQAYFKNHPEDMLGLYVATACVNDKKDPYRAANILYLERLLIWKYVERFGHLPAWNKQ
jgi:uncharacterized protein (DUF433 family)